MTQVSDETPEISQSAAWKMLRALMALRVDFHRSGTLTPQVRDQIQSAVDAARTDVDGFFARAIDEFVARTPCHGEPHVARR